MELRKYPALFFEIIYDIYSRYFVKLLIVKGKVLLGGKEVTCMFVDNGNTGEYLIKKCFYEDSVIAMKKRVLIKSLKYILKRNTYDVDVCVAAIPKCYDEYFNEICSFKSTRMVRQIVDISGTLDQIRSKYHKNIKNIDKKMLQYGYSCRMSNSEQEFNHFYYNMFLPLVRNRHGELARVESFDNLRKIFLTGALLFVEESGKQIAGAVISFDGDRVICRREGVLNGSKEYIKKSVQSAVNYFGIQFAKEKGYASFDLMGSLSFMNNGVYTSKRVWGADAYLDEEAEDFVYYFNLKDSEGLHGFYSQTLPIVIDKEGGGLLGVIGGGSNGTDASEIQSISERHIGQGINRIVTPAICTFQ